MELVDETRSRVRVLTEKIDALDDRIMDEEDADKRGRMETTVAQLEREREEAKLERDRVHQLELAKLKRELVTPTEFTLRPVIGYGEEEYVVQVQSLDELQEEAAKVFGDDSFRFYWCSVDDDGNPVSFSSGRREINTDRGLVHCRDQGKSCVWVSRGKISPKSSPVKSKLVHFTSDGCPLTFEDDTFVELKERFLSASNLDNPALLIFAIPGSGKTTTVKRVAKDVSAEYIRIKLAVSDPLYLETMRLAKDATIASIGDYDLCKLHFADACNDFVKNIETRIPEKRLTVVHIDEAQVLMDQWLITRESCLTEDWTKSRGALRSFLFPQFCDALNGLLGRHENVRVVISGTNAFSGITLNSGSQLKVKHLQLVGRFPVEWVLETLVVHLKIPGDLIPTMKEVLGLLCMNRRACWYFLRNIWRHCDVGSPLTATVLEELAKEAVGEWCKSPRQSLRNARASVIRAWSLLQMPQSYSGKASEIQTKKLGTVQCLRFPVAELEEIMDYAVSGALNVWVSKSGKFMDVEVPVGCVNELFSELVKFAMAVETFNAEECKAFVRVSKTNAFDKGHAFERLFAAELTMFRSPLYSVLAKKMESFGTFSCDPLVFARPFVYEARILQSEWTAHCVHCVNDDNVSSGRIVDVGCPMMETDGQNSQVRVMFQLSTLEDENDNWRKCWDFFNKTSNKALNTTDVFCYVSLYAFMDHEPRKASAKHGSSACDSRDLTLQVIANNSGRAFILEGDDLRGTCLPFRLIMDQLCLPVDPVEVVTDMVSEMYVGPATPIKMKKCN
jgi:hypothetical protein